MSNTPLGNLFSVLNNALDSKVAKSIGVRKMLEKATYTSAFNGVKVVSKAAKTFSSPKKQKKEHRLTDQKKKNLFDLSLSDDEQMVVDTLNDFVAQKVKPIAEECSEKGKLSDDLVQSFNELGITYYSIPEAMGGVLNQKATVTQMLITERLAFGDVGIALGLLTPIGALNALVAYGSAAQQEKYIPPFLEENERFIATIAVNEDQPLFNPFELETTAKKTNKGYTINGEKSIVPLAEYAGFYLVAALVKGEGVKVFIVEAKSKGITIKRNKSMGLHAAELCKIKFKNVEIGKDAVLVETNQYADFINYIKLSWCALSVGAAKAALEYVIEYGNSREAFGEPITHRQAVAFMIANIKIELEGMEVLTQRAVSKAEQGLDFTREAYLASVFCADKAMEIGTNSVQLLGGYGFCRDYPAERWYRDLRAVGLQYNGMHL